VGQIAGFLSYQFDMGLEYSTLNSYRAALSAYHPKVEGYAVGQHPWIIKLLRGAFNKRPPRPRYTTTWDVNIVLEYIKKLGDNEKVSLKDLSLKLTMLMAVTTVSRGSELHKLSPLLITDLGNEMELHFVGLTKTARPSKPHRSIMLHEYEGEESLDVIRCLRAYLTRTEPLRVTEAQKQSLLVSYVKPHNPITSCSVARWLKMVMSLAGIDTSIFKAHSTRAAAASKAREQGVSTKQIMKCANWARANTFHRFYNKPIQIRTERSDLVSGAVLAN